MICNQMISPLLLAELHCNPIYTCEVSWLHLKQGNSVRSKKLKPLSDLLAMFTSNGGNDSVLKNIPWLFFTGSCNSLTFLLFFDLPSFPIESLTVPSNFYMFLHFEFSHNFHNFFPWAIPELHRINAAGPGPPAHLARWLGGFRSLRSLWSFRVQRAAAVEQRGQRGQRGVGGEALAGQRLWEIWGW